jgi:hypothetical protein
MILRVVPTTTGHLPLIRARGFPLQQFVQSVCSGLL